MRVPDDPLPWLLRTASHQVLHVLRAGRRRDRLAHRSRAEWPVDVGDHADQVATRHDASRLVAVALGRLSPPDQEVLRLAAWEQLDSSEIAYVLGCSEVAARVRLHRAKRRIARHLETHAADPGPEVHPFVPSTCEVQP